MNATKSITISRKQYDRLIDTSAAWMKLRWAEYSKQWGLGGVTVTGPEAAIENLLAQLAQ